MVTLGEIAKDKFCVLFYLVLKASIQFWIGAFLIYGLKSLKVPSL